MSNTKPSRIYFSIGQDEQVHQQNLNNLLAQDAYFRIQELLGKAVERLKAIKNDFDFDKHRSHDAILLNGNRGTGKTAVLANLNMYLKKNEDLYAKLLVLRPIDPTLLEGHENLFLNVIIAAIVGDETVARAIANGGSEVENFHDQLERVGQALEGIQRQDEQYGLEKLRSFVGSIGLAREAHLLFGATLKMVNKELIVMPIDDVDTALEYAFDQIEIVRKYLVTPFVIPVVCGDLDLYHEVIWRHFYGRLMLEGNTAAAEAEQRARQLSMDYLRKVLPLPRRIPVPSLADYLNDERYYLSNSDDARGDKLLSFPAFKHWLTAILNERVNGIGGSLLELPLNSIREFSQLIADVREDLKNLPKKLVEIDKSFEETANAEKKKEKARKKELEIRRMVLKEPKTFEKWEEKLVNFFEKHSVGHVIAATLATNKYWREIKAEKSSVSYQSVLDMELFRPNLKYSSKLFSDVSFMKCTWRSDLQEYLPDYLLEKLPEKTMLYYPHLEVGEPVKIEGKKGDFFTKLVTFNAFLGKGERCTMLVSGRIFEVLILSLIRDVTPTDIIEILNRPPFHSIEAYLAYEDQAAVMREDKPSKPNATSNNDWAMEQLQSKMLSDGLNKWRYDNKAGIAEYPHAWLIFKVMKRYFGRSWGWSNQPEKNGSSAAGQESGKTTDFFQSEISKRFEAIWIIFGELEKGLLYKEVSPEEYASDEKEKPRYHQEDFMINVMPLLGEYEDIKIKPYTSLLRTHPLRNIDEAIVVNEERLSEPPSAI